MFRVKRVLDHTAKYIAEKSLCEEARSHIKTSSREASINANARFQSIKNRPIWYIFKFYLVK